MGEVLGLVAGSGRLPFALARAARAEGYRVVAVGHRGQTDPALEAEVDQFHWVWLGQLGRIAGALSKGGARRAVMGGGLDKTASFSSARPDLAALKLWATLGKRGDDRVLRAIADWFAQEGIEIVAPDHLLVGCFAEEGPIAGPTPAKEALADAVEGLRIAHLLGQADVGQTVAIREGAVLAVEAMEGTDACIRRAGQLAERAVVVKAAKPGQDRRFDLPAIGAGTVGVLAAAKARLLAVEAGATIVLDRDDLKAAAKAAKISIWGLRP
ncbi:MAG TPA: UDP-2,3-diacylglucosamine diphosphatase LpxI [Myxococcales bacterium]|nr:UDP-2,3-diacylglucosamine diphosphatase LpxI [Myxococcales bacterium]